MDIISDMNLKNALIFLLFLIINNEARERSTTG